MVSTCFCIVCSFLYYCHGCPKSNNIFHGYCHVCNWSVVGKTNNGAEVLTGKGNCMVYRCFGSVYIYSLHYSSSISVILSVGTAEYISFFCILSGMCLLDRNKRYQRYFENI